jgi:hypothetical protein
MPEPGEIPPSASASIRPRFATNEETLLESEQFDQIARLRAVMTRRASLATLGTTAMAGLAGPITGDAKRKNRKKGDVNNLQRCKQQAGAWIDFVPTFCGDGAVCQELIACATPLKSCDFTGFLTCFGSSEA